MKLTSILSPIRRDLGAVESFVLSDLKALRDRHLHRGEIPLSFAPVRHLFSSRGKSLRPALLLLSSGAVSKSDSLQSDASHQAASVVELVHSASLIHDDVIDESNNRREIESVHQKYGVKTAILAGDILFSHSFTVLKRLPNVSDAVKLELFELFSELAKQMCFGELLEQKHESGTDSLNDYLRILDLKTARLMSVSALAGAKLAGGNETQVEAAGLFGFEFGMAYQLVDDFVDGDSIYRGNIDYPEVAKMRIERAKMQLSSIGGYEGGASGWSSNAESIDENIFAESLGALCDWVLEQS